MSKFLITYATPLWLIILVMVFILIIFSAVVFFAYKWAIQKWMDKIILIDKTNRWQLISTRLKGSTEFKFGKDEYNIIEDSTLLNRRGKALLVYSKGKPTPMKLGYNMNRYLNNDSLKAVIKSKVLQKMLSSEDTLKDSLILIGSIAAILSAIASVVVLLKTFGILK